MSVQKTPPAALAANSVLNSPVLEGFDFNPLAHPIVFAMPRRLTPISAWHEHIPFGMYLVSRLKPNVIVELGAHSGDSYCAFCQAVQELYLDARCYAVDTWQGDAQSGYYGPEVLNDLRAFHDPLYGSFSQLIQSTFSAALEHFPDDSIDLLHLDGYHTYEAARADLMPWLAKVSPRGVVLLHDVNVRERDFGVWRLWQELAPHFPHFAFYHGHGLGVIAVGPLAGQELGDFFNTLPQEAQRIRTFFARLGQGLNRAIPDEAQLQQLTRDLQAERGEVARVNADKTQLEQRVQLLTVELNELKPRIENDQLAYTARIAALQLTLDEQTQHLDALATQIERMATRETELRTLFLDAQAELMERDRELDRLTSATSPLSQQTARLQFLDAEIENLKRILAARDEGIEWLRSELDLENAQIRAMRSSRVWRARERVRKALGVKP